MSISLRVRSLTRSKNEKTVNKEKAAQRVFEFQAAKLKLL